MLRRYRTPPLIGARHVHTLGQVQRPAESGVLSLRGADASSGAGIAPVGATKCTGMGTSEWSQIDAGVALTVGAIVVTAAVRKLQRPRAFALTLRRLDPALSSRRALTVRFAYLVAGYELIVGSGVVVFRGVVGFVAACGLLVACVGFLIALARAVQQSVPCACFGRLGRTAAGGREIGRAIALVGCSGFLVVQRAVNIDANAGFGGLAAAAVVGTTFLIVTAQIIGAAARPGVELPGAAASAAVAESSSLASMVRRFTGYDNDLYTAARSRRP